MAVLPVLRTISAEMQRRVPGLRVEYSVAGAASKQGAPALIWELQGGPITTGGFPVGDPKARTLAIRSVVVVAELRARESSAGTTDRDLEAAEELLRHLCCALDLKAPADYKLSEDWRAANSVKSAKTFSFVGGWRLWTAPTARPAKRFRRSKRPQAIKISSPPSDQAAERLSFYAACIGFQSR